MRLVDDIEAQRAGRDTRPQKDREEMVALGLSLLDFLERPPARCPKETQRVLFTAMGMLKLDVDAIDEARETPQKKAAE
jgi:hypothetical protein